MIMPDVNLLVAISSPTHTAHVIATGWLAKNAPVATCAITELGMLRVLIQLGAPASVAEGYLARFVSLHRTPFVPCDISAEALKNKI